MDKHSTASEKSVLKSFHEQIEIFYQNLHAIKLIRKLCHIVESERIILHFIIK